MAGRKVVLLVGTSSLAVIGLLRWRARRRALLSAEQAEKMVEDGPLVSTTCAYRTYKQTENALFGLGFLISFWLLLP